MSAIINFPRQQLPFSKKTKEWRKQCVDWANSKTFFNYSLVRKSVRHKKINYDLLIGKLHMQDLHSVVNPDNLNAGFIPDTIQHYPIMNSKLQVLRGEEFRRVFDYKVVITNPNSISEIENTKKEEILQRLHQAVTAKVNSQEEMDAELSKISDYFTYEWQDFREIRANALLNHYEKEYNMPAIFNEGFMDAMIVGEELYQCDIVGGEPVISRLNPLKVRVLRSGFSNKVEDADIIITEDYWSPGKVIDTFYDVLSKKDIDYIENIPSNLGQAYTDDMDNIDERFGFVNNNMIGEDLAINGQYFDPTSLYTETPTLLPYDMSGNLRVLRIYWKSRRKIKKVKLYNPETGEEEFNFYPETYKINKELGEEEQIFYINEAWEGTKIGADIYVNMRPRLIQYNRLSNPSRCHFGIVGSIYNLNDERPYSLVDMMKHYNYLYDVIHDRLNKMIANNWGKIMKVDLASIPKGWDMNKWMYFAKTSNIAVMDSFREGEYGAATGKLAGGLNNNNSGVIDAELGNSIQMLINLLEFIKMEMSEVAGISRQREGQVSNRETVGGVERATLQSSHITEWLFLIHDDVKRRALECFLETAKIAMKGRSKKFQYILSDTSQKIVDVQGDEFAESDYGLVVDNSQGTQELAQKMEMLAQAALQNQLLDFSTIMKIYGSSSIAEKQRYVNVSEAKMKESQQQQMQAEQQSAQAIAEQQMQMQQAELQQKEQANIRDNETKLLIANIQATSSIEDGIQEPEYSEEAKDKLLENIRQFEEKLKLEREKLSLEKEKHKDDVSLKEKALNKKPTNTKT